MHAKSTRAKFTTFEDIEKVPESLSLPTSVSRRKRWKNKAGSTRMNGVLRGIIKNYVDSRLFL